MACRCLSLRALSGCVHTGPFPPYLALGSCRSSGSSLRPFPKAETEFYNPARFLTEDTGWPRVPV